MAGRLAMGGPPASASQVFQAGWWAPAEVVDERPPSVLRDRHVPEERRGELEDALDVLPESRRPEPLSPRHVCHFAKSDPLDVLGDQLALRLIGRTHPIGGQLLALRGVGPAEASVRARPGYAKVGGGADYVPRPP